MLKQENNGLIPGNANSLSERVEKSEDGITMLKQMIT